ncbi:energy-coupling factor transport system ATP-binding protein [Cytobacillus horneckiae]|uniref:Energy-coupling factor ABC transporter ATP-binding protein n=1 Tax=Cytobacillus horneckiae TaxID=549687 RepID=A0A2N0ZGT2_9BACI|nr:energy-coupling factor ABC transporter ATP-binding protein [Cytobacillus horneckiae]NRG45814.1 energy-coupling factor ABC transporter ATP-binding protein [Bacillus sp. CRN 9]MBN6889697.1 energy-coupling factor ABC transporter ATP-binding protein [Cytobacillus horneckiae]MCM3181060.1 energy-coupling factor ABC transporter ATP-binding protein [Cytobacillus horneckiae]MEC1155875.1 energy-coupling factor ABC transporter ATP-binding protein [Cytobacillus horneckiae]MED2937991.1 energy-coupling f
MKKSLVQLNDISFKYDLDGDYALRNVSFDIYEGEWLAIVGHNGSGKSTMAKLLNGLNFPQEGSITVGELKLSEETVWDIRERIGMVFQNPDNQFVGTTVQDDVAFGLENHGIPREEMVERVYKALESVKMDQFLDQEPHHLSGGQKQRVAIAGVLALRPDIIVLDEATSMLDPRGREEVLETVRVLKKNHEMTVISITHDLEEAAKADRIIVMNKGQVYKQGTPEEIFQLDEELVALGLDIPFPVKMSKMLKSLDLPVSKYHLSEEELVAELWTSHSKM